MTKKTLTCVKSRGRYLLRLVGVLNIWIRILMYYFIGYMLTAKTTPSWLNTREKAKRASLLLCSAGLSVFPLGQLFGFLLWLTIVAGICQWPNSLGADKQTVSNCSAGLRHLGLRLFSQEECNLWYSPSGFRVQNASTFVNEQRKVRYFQLPTGLKWSQPLPQVHTRLYHRDPARQRYRVAHNVV